MEREVSDDSYHTPVKILKQLKTTNRNKSILEGHSVERICL